MLYAFDGTGNKDEDGTKFDTNVVKLVEAYQGQTLYQTGVGTGGWFARVLGKLFGYGGLAKVAVAIKHLRARKTTEVIDVAGFSRGAALAIHFCNEIQQLGYQVRCLMLFDTVASFGIAGNDINIGYTLTTPTNCEHIFHAMALDERRKLFPLTRVRGATEVWFRGFHSDIGGGNGNQGLNNISLDWMTSQAKAIGLDLEAESHHMCYPQAQCCKPKDFYPNTLRLVARTDKLHESVSWRKWVAEGFVGNNPPQLHPFTRKKI